MVILVDLDDDTSDPAIRSREDFDDLNIKDDNSTVSGRVVAALGCYPIVLEIARSLDLNSLHDLSRTSRQIRANLIQYRRQLIKQTLRCMNDEITIGRRLADRMRESHYSWTRTNGEAWNGKILSGRVGLCARDMVGECRRCGVIVCRNCTIKPPSQRAMQGRHRRLCCTCMKVPLRSHSSVADLSFPAPAPVAGYFETFSRGPCRCTDGAYLCHSCGTGVHDDTIYIRCWTWRTRYSTYLGGLGTGIGEGNEGVKCGRGECCLAAKEVEEEIDSDGLESEQVTKDFDTVSGAGRPKMNTGYMTQEIEGIGGVVKKKVKKRVKVGAVVKEYEDEREHGHYLSREQKGVNRSWCFWCSRVIPSQRDRLDPDRDMAAAVLAGSSEESSVNTPL